MVISMAGVPATVPEYEMETRVSGLLTMLSTCGDTHRTVTVAWRKCLAYFKHTKRITCLQRHYSGAAQHKVERCSVPEQCLQSTTDATTRAAAVNYVDTRVHDSGFGQVRALLRQCRFEGALRCLNLCWGDVALKLGDRGPLGAGRAELQREGDGVFHCTDTDRQQAGTVK